MSKIQIFVYRRNARYIGHIGVSLRMEHFIAERDWHIDQIFVDAGPAPKMGLRPGMQRLIAALDPEADERHVLIESLDRLDRRADHAMALLRTFEEAGVQVHSMDGTPTAAAIEMYLTLAVQAK